MGIVSNLLTWWRYQMEFWLPKVNTKSLINLRTAFDPNLLSNFFKPMEVNEILGSACTGDYLISWEIKDVRLMKCLLFIFFLVKQ